MNLSRLDLMLKFLNFKLIKGGLENLGLNSVQDVRVGKNITLQVNADSPEAAKAIGEEAAKKLLANAVMEYFEVNVL